MANYLRLLHVLILIAAPVLSFAQSDRTVYVGTYTRQNSKGIYAYRFDTKTGKVTETGLAGETSNPSFLALHPNGKYLYAVNEDKDGHVTSFSIDPASGKLTMLNQVSSQGSGPCALALDKTGKWLFVANYNNGSIAAYPVGADGKLGEASATDQHKGSSVNKQRQAGPHAHSTVLSPDNRFLLVNDLGLDQIFAYRLDTAKGIDTASPVISKTPAGGGPRHLAFGSKGKFAYACNEMMSSVTTYSYDAKTGELKEVQTVSMLPKDFTGSNSAAEIAVHPSGKFVYASNRGHNSIVRFDIDPAKGTLTAADWTPTDGKTPRNFAIDPTGGYLFAANQDGGGVVVFRIDKGTGKLEPTGTKLDVPVPVCVVFK
jgi:6-phosphogluconolactonase